MDADPDLAERRRPTLSIVPEFLGGDGIRFGDHPFGQDEVGRDIFAVVMRGTQQSIMIMVIVGLIATTIGTVIGAVAGYYRGWQSTRCSCASPTSSSRSP